MKAQLERTSQESNCVLRLGTIDQIDATARAFGFNHVGDDRAGDRIDLSVVGHSVEWIKRLSARFCVLRTPAFGQNLRGYAAISRGGEDDQFADFYTRWRGLGGASGRIHPPARTVVAARLHLLLNAF